MKLSVVFVNILTLSRLAAAVAVAYYAGRQEWLVTFGWAIGGFGTDLVDGAFARWLGAETVFGEYADPIVDILFDWGVILGATLGGLIGPLLAAYLVVSAAILRLPTFAGKTSNVFRIQWLFGAPYVVCMLVFVVWPLLLRASGRYLYHWLAVIFLAVFVGALLKRERLAREWKNLIRIVLNK